MLQLKDKVREKVHFFDRFILLALSFLRREALSVGVDRGKKKEKVLSAEVAPYSPTGAAEIYLPTREKRQMGRVRVATVSLPNLSCHFDWSLFVPSSHKESQGLAVITTQHWVRGQSGRLLGLSRAFLSLAILIKVLYYKLEGTTTFSSSWLCMCLHHVNCNIMQWCWWNPKFTSFQPQSDAFSCIHVSQFQRRLVDRVLQPSVSKAYA